MRGDILKENTHGGGGVNFSTCVGERTHAQALPRTWAAAHQLSELYTTGPWEPGPARAKKLPRPHCHLPAR